jgi:hypothetical protein
MVINSINFHFPYVSWVFLLGIAELIIELKTREGREIKWWSSHTMYRRKVINRHRENFLFVACTCKKSWFNDEWGDGKASSLNYKLFCEETACKFFSKMPKIKLTFVYNKRENFCSALRERLINMEKFITRSWVRTRKFSLQRDLASCAVLIFINLNNWVF